MPINKNLVLVDGPNRDNLLPLCYTRPVADLRIGITTLREKWEALSGRSCSINTQDYLSVKFPMILESDNVFAMAGIVPDEKLIETLDQLKTGEALIADEELIAYRSVNPKSGDEVASSFKSIQYTHTLVQVKNSWDIFELNDAVLRADFDRLTAGKRSHPLSLTNTVLGKENIFVEAGASVECATINAKFGPVFIGKHSEIMEGVMIRGPLALCEHASLKMGAKIYGATTIGPYCKVGGEVHNSVFTGYSSKAHDGYLGNAVLGEWCNLGADTNNSNLKNNYDKVKIWSYSEERFVNTGLQFCGLIMGDHSKSAINTMFNTGTVIGISANIFGAGFPRNIIPSFSWGGAGATMTYSVSKALETARIVMKRRNLELGQDDIDIFTHIFEITGKYRKK